VTPIPTAQVIVTYTMTPTVTLTPSDTPTATHTPTASPTQPPTIAPTSSFTPTLSPTPTATITPTLERQDHYRLSRPIARIGEQVDYVDRTYPYGGTQFGQREVHIGVEFFNPRHTTIIAAADGEVIYAGDDDANQYGPTTGYYGNLVVLEHDITSPTGLTVYTLYGHMQEISVARGQQIFRGEPLGTVGDTGIAIGPHLHFEVRLENPMDYRRTTNPELWIQPYQGFGTLAGRVVNPDGIEVQGATILVSNDRLRRETYTYGGDRVNSDIVWGENFVLGDLPQGDYDVVVPGFSGQVRYRGSMTIQAGRTTWMDIRLER